MIRGCRWPLVPEVGNGHEVKDGVGMPVQDAVADLVDARKREVKTRRVAPVHVHCGVREAGDVQDAGGVRAVGQQRSGNRCCSGEKIGSVAGGAFGEHPAVGEADQVDPAGINGQSVGDVMDDVCKVLKVVQMMGGRIPATFPRIPGLTEAVAIGDSDSVPAAVALGVGIVDGVVERGGRRWGRGRRETGCPVM